MGFRVQGCSWGFRSPVALEQSLLRSTNTALPLDPYEAIQKLSKNSGNVGWSRDLAVDTGSLSLHGMTNPPTYPPTHCCQPCNPDKNVHCQSSFFFG